MRPRVHQVESVPRHRVQRTPPGDQHVATPLPVKATNIGQHITPDTLGRFPTIGIDSGAIPGTRPDHRRY